MKLLSVLIMLVVVGVGINKSLAEEGLQSTNPDPLATIQKDSNSSDCQEKIEGQESTNFTWCKSGKNKKQLEEAKLTKQVQRAESKIHYPGIRAKESGEYSKLKPN